MKKYQWIWLFSHAFGVAGVVVFFWIIAARPEDLTPYVTALSLFFSCIGLWVWGWRVWYHRG